MSDVEHKLSRQMQAAQVLKEALGVYGDDDLDLIRDSIEGETNLHEAIEAIVKTLDEDGILIDGIEARIADLSERKARFENRVERKRAMIEQAFVIGELEKMERPTFTLSLRKVPPALNLEDEALVPSRFFKPQAPKLDRKELLAALRVNAERLKARGEALAAKERGDAYDDTILAEDIEPIPGATLTNGGVGITIRRK